MYYSIIVNDNVWLSETAPASTDQAPKINMD